MERRDNPGNVELRSEEGKPSVITGYAAVYYDGTPKSEYRLKDNVVERIKPGAFDGYLASRKDVIAAFNHDPARLLGRLESGTLHLTADNVGLRYDIEMGDTTAHRDVMELVRRGDLKGSSFSFRCKPKTGQRWFKDGDQEVRELLDVDLYDVGPVVTPAYSGTAVSARSLQEEWEEEITDDEPSKLLEIKRRGYQVRAATL